MNDSNLLTPPAPSDIDLPVAEPLRYTKLDFGFCLLALLAGYLGVKLILSGFLGAGATLFALLFGGLLLGWAVANRQELSLDRLVYLLLFVLTGLQFILFDNRDQNALALLLMALLAVYFVMAASGLRIRERLSGYAFLDLLDGIVLPLRNLLLGPRIVTEQVKSSKGGRNLLLLLLGLVLAVPVLLVVGYLLQSADAAFETLWNRFTSGIFNRLFANLWQLLFSLPLGCFFFALLFASKQRQGQPLRTPESAALLAEKARFFPHLLLVGVITPLLLMYGVFFVSQMAYFLSAFANLLPEGYDITTYARRGFFELCYVSAINFGLIFVLLFLTKKGGKNWLFQLYAVLLSGCTLAMIVISLRKMLLYIQIGGLTPKRVYTSWFMLLLFIVFIFIIIKVFREKFPAGKWTCIVTVAMFLILCFANPSQQIAHYNVNAYTTGALDRLDVELLDQLGAAGTPYLLQVLEIEGLTEKQYEQAVRSLYWRWQNAQIRHNQDWRNFDRVSWQSRQLLAANGERIEALYEQTFTADGVDWRGEF